jgi:hypothetical protein
LLASALMVNPLVEIKEELPLCGRVRGRAKAIVEGLEQKSPGVPIYTSAWAQWSEHTRPACPVPINIGGWYGLEYAKACLISLAELNLLEVFYGN